MSQYHTSRWNHEDMAPAVDEYPLDELDVLEVQMNDASSEWRGEPAINVVEYESGILSPDHVLERPIIINEIAFPTVKHAYWACLIKGDREDRHTISRIVSGGVLARKSFNLPKIADYGTKRYAVMSACVTLALRANPDMIVALDLTGDLPLTYDTPWKDAYFGSSRGGANKYGDILQKLRERHIKYNPKGISRQEVAALERMGVDLRDWESERIERVFAACKWTDEQGEHVMLTDPRLAAKWQKAGEGRMVERTTTVDFDKPYRLTIRNGTKVTWWISSDKECQKLLDDWRIKNKGFFHHNIKAQQIQVLTPDNKVGTITPYEV